jgi:acetylglutamate kinase
MKNILIKGSGDTLGNPKFIGFIKEKLEKNKVVVICGGGTPISEALVKAGYKIEYDHLGRVLKTKKEKDIARKVLEKEKRNLRKLLSSRKIEVISPVLMAGSVECHINADNLAKAYYLGFDSVYIFTLRNRVADKKEVFRNYPKVKIIGI